MERKLFSFSLFFACIYAFAQASVGYFQQQSVQQPPLKTDLKNIIKQENQGKAYNGLWNAYYTTDRNTTYENEGTIMGIYSENPTCTDPYNLTVGNSQCGTYSG